MVSEISQKAITVAPGGATVTVNMTTPQKAQTVITAGGTPVAKPATVPTTPLASTPPAATTTPANRVTVVSQVRSHSQSLHQRPIQRYTQTHPEAFILTSHTGNARKRKEV